MICRELIFRPNDMSTLGLSEMKPRVCIYKVKISSDYKLGTILHAVFFKNCAEAAIV